MSRDCSHCGITGFDGPDACLGWLDGVDQACCGHGWANSPYVVFDDETRLDGRAAIAFFEEREVGPPPVDTVTTFMFDQYDGKVVVEAEYRYANGRLVAVRWRNESDAEPTWAFDGVKAKLTKGVGVVPLPDLVCSLVDGEIVLPFRVVETVGG